MPLKPSAPLKAVLLWALSVLVGVVAGVGAVGFRALIALFHNLLFLGKLSAAYDASEHTPASPWGPWVILVPVAGAFGVAFLVKNFAPEAKGHGVPEVMDAIYHRQGNIRPIVSVIKALASALSIGSGGSVGREGPIIQIGSAFGSTVGQLLRLPPWQRITLIAAGAGGGIAATFNTPVGGVLFAVELMMHEISSRTLVPVITATATASYVGQLFFGPHPAFWIPKLEMLDFTVALPAVLGAYAGLGLLTGAVSAAFIRSIYGCELFFQKHVKGGYYAQHASGMLIVGLIMYALLARTGHYYVEGVGYATIQDILTGLRIPLVLLFLLFAAKLLSTSLTLGSGASGGVFSPALFMGATSGGGYGLVLNHLFPALHVSPEAFAIAGMAGVVGGATGAAMTAIVMIFEMTLDYTVIIPLTLTVAISYAVRRSLIQDSIYTRKLTLRGTTVPEDLRADVHFSRCARDVMNRRIEIAPAARTPSSGSDPVLLITNPAGEVISVAVGGDAPRENFITVKENDRLSEVVTRLHNAGASVALVTSPNGGSAATAVRGAITDRNIVDALADDLNLF